MSPELWEWIISHSMHCACTRVMDDLQGSQLGVVTRFPTDLSIPLLFGEAHNSREAHKTTGVSNGTFWRGYSGCTRFDIAGLCKDQPRVSSMTRSTIQIMLFTSLYHPTHPYLLFSRAFHPHSHDKTIPKSTKFMPYNFKRRILLRCVAC